MSGLKLDVTESDLRRALEQTHKLYPHIGLLDDLDVDWLARTLTSSLRSRGAEHKPEDCCCAWFREDDDTWGMAEVVGCPVHGGRGKGQP